MKLIYGRILQVLSIFILIFIFIKMPVGWTPWLIIPIVLFLVGHHLIKFHKAMLHMAARTGNVQAIQKLLQSGFQIDRKLDSGFTPLHWATLKQHGNAVQLLLENGALPNVGDRIGRMPLSYAKEIGNTEIINILVNAGAK